MGTKDRKLQAEIERTLKKVVEGIEVFDGIWTKVYSASTPSQKEKYEGDLKKEIKKLQRYRDQIKTWAASSDIKDKKPLLEARKDIEKKMEQFKLCEKETKTKAFSKEGLSQAEKVDPKTREQRELCTWVQDQIDSLSSGVEMMEGEMETLASSMKKGKKPPRLEVLEEIRENHQWHIGKLEIVLRMLENDSMPNDQVKEVQENVEYYVNEYEDCDFYFDDTVYDDMELVENEDDMVKVDTGDDDTPFVDDEPEELPSKPSKKEAKKEKEAVVPAPTPSKAAPTPAPASGRPTIGKQPVVASTRPTLASGPSATAAAAASTGPTPVPASKIEAAAAAPNFRNAALQPPAVGASGGTTFLQQQQLAQQRQAQVQAQQVQAQQVQAQQVQAQQQKAAVAVAVVADGTESSISIGDRSSGVSDDPSGQGGGSTPMSNDAGGNYFDGDARQGAGGVPGAQGGVVGGGGQSQGSGSSTPGAASSSSPQASGTSWAAGLVSPEMGFAAQQSLLDSSLRCMPCQIDCQRHPHGLGLRSPQGSLATALFENTAMYDRLDPDMLFFIFYYQQGTYQQFLAARELKRQSWRFHKKYLTWFQRHEDPKTATSEYETGTYVYFDYETGWCQRIKTDFTFEYGFLEDDSAF